MRNQHVVCLFLISVLLSSVGLCRGNCTNRIVPKKSSENIEKIAERLTESLADAKTYFETACRISETDSEALKTQKLTSLTNKPITSGLRTSIPFVDGSGESTQDFLKKVSEKIHARHEFNKQLASKIANCTDDNLKPDDLTCKAVNSWLENQLPQIARLARYNLALGHHSQNASLLGTNAELNLNKELNDKKSSKEISWEPLSPEETRIAQDGFKNIQSEVGQSIVERASGQPKSERAKLYVNDLLKVRHTHYMIYLSFMGINPILQFIKSEKPSRSEINFASKQILQNLEKEKKSLEKIDYAIASPFHVGRSGTKSFDSSVLDLMNYRTEVEEVLLANPQFCGMGVALNQVKSNRQTSVAVAGLPILAVSFFVPPLYGLAIGALSAGYFVYDSQGKLSENLVRENARVQREGLSDLLQNISTEGKSSDQIRDDLQKDVTRIYRKNLQALRQSESDRDASVVLAPVVLVSPIASRYIASYSKTMFTAFSAKP